MAKKRKKTKRQIQYNSIQKNSKTTPGIQASGGTVQASEFDLLDDDTLMQDITDMRDGDAIPSTTLEVLKLPIKASPMRIEPGTVNEGEDDRTAEAAKYIEDQFNNLYDGFDDFKNHCLLSLDYGHILFEKIIQRGIDYININGRKVKTTIISRMSPINYDGIEDIYYNDNMDFDGIMHNKYTPDNVVEQVPISADNLYMYTHNMEFRDVTGRSELRPARLAYTLKKRILIAGARGIQRGTFPLIGINNKSMEDAANTIGRTAGSTEYAYITYDMNNVKVEMAELKNQGNLMEMLQYLDRQMFFNTLSQFMTSGLGENGSRAATSELKTSYELKANAILQEFEVHVQRLVNEMMYMSYLATIPRHQWPIFKLGAITQADLTAVATNLKTLTESGLVAVTPEIKEYVNEMFSLPESEVKQEIVDDEEALEITLTNNFTSHRELTEFEKEVFEFDNAVRTFKTTQEKAETIVQSDLNEFIDKIKSRLETNLKSTIPFKSYKRDIDSTTAKLTEVYTEAFNQGNTDVVKEFNKVVKKKTELALKQSAEITVKKALKNSVQGLYEKVALSIESKMDSVSPAFVEKKGGLSKFIDTFKDFFKGDKRRIVTETQAGYTDGRGSQIEANQDKIDQLIYTTALDENVCEVCDPFDGQEFTPAEFKQSGLNIGSPVNPDCLGNSDGSNKCRCQMIILSAKDDLPADDREIKDRILDPKIRIK